jgi:hypothetical protein
MMMEWTTDARALLLLMETLSERCWCAGWEIDLEYNLWAVMHGDSPAGYGMFPDELDDLRVLSERIGGWIVRNDGHADGSDEWRRIMPIEEWRERYQSRAIPHDGENVT